MINLTKYELKLIAGNRGIENYKNMSSKKLLRTLNKSDRNFKNISLKDPSELQKCRVFHKINLRKSKE